MQAVLAVIVAVSALAMTPQAAQAYYTSSYSGATGSSRFGYTGPAVASHPGWRFITPSLIVGRNGAISGGYQQEVQVIVELQRWNGSSWATATWDRRRQWADLGTNGVSVFDPVALQAPVRSAGYFRVVTTISWGSAAVANMWSGRITGHHQFAANANGDFSCAYNTAGCRNLGTANGAMLITG